MVVEAGGSSDGAGRVCNNTERGTEVDIGNMSREWKDSEAATTDGYTFDCVAGSASRHAIQVDVSKNDCDLTMTQRKAP